MEFFNNKKDLSQQVKTQSFDQWVVDNRSMIESHLIHAGIAFINEQAESLKQSVTNLMLDDRWHYIDKPTKKQSYRGSLEINSQGIPYLFLRYFTFRHGGYSARFNSKEVLKELWKDARRGIISKPRPVTPKNQPLKSTPEKENVFFDWVGHHLKLWNSLSTAGTSPYLKRKGLGNTFIPGIRFAKNYIAVALINTENAFQGMQCIYNDGEKRYTKGMTKKGHFGIVGDTTLPQKPRALHVCEGLATAASIYLATGESVFCAFDAGNLLPVSRNLKRHYPKTPIILWADNDWQKATKKTKHGRILGNTGLIHANRTAFKLRNALVCTPDFSSLPPEQIKEATDFNDLHQLLGIEAITQTIAQKPNISLALWHESSRYTRYAHGVLAPQKFAKGIKRTYKKRYLPKDVFQHEGVHLVRSAIGTGKTAIVEHLVKNNPHHSILFTTHLISLVESAAQRLGLVSYNECDAFDLQIENRVAICLNSLGKLTAEGALKTYDVVIIDEIEQVLARLTTHIEQKPLVFSVLKHLMMHTKTLICLDAHLSQTTVQIIQRFCPNHPVTVHFNEYTPGHGRKILFHDNPESVQMNALHALEQNQKVYLAFNSKKEAYKTFSACSIAFPEKKGLYISSDNAGDAENQAFFNNVNQISQRYDYLICTPSVSTGVSIDNGHFDFVGGVFNAQINTANDCMQALGRIRNHQTLHVFCEKRLGNKTLNPEVISAKWANTHLHDLNLMNIDALSGARILLNPDYEQLALLVTQARNASNNNFYEQFALLALHDGMHLAYFEEDMDLGIQKQLKNFKKACIEHDANQICREQLPLTASELLALAKKPRKTMADTRAYKKQQLIEFYNLSEKDNQSIQALATIDNDGRFKKQIVNLELALGDVELAKKHFLAQLQESNQFAADLNYFASLQSIYQKLLRTLRVTTSNGTLDTSNYQYSKELLQHSDFLHWIEQNRPIIQGIVTLPTPDRLYKDPIRFVSMLLSHLGLKQKRVGRAEFGLYQLEPSRVQLLNALIMRRKKGCTGISMPLDTSSCAVKKSTSTDFFVTTFRKIKEFILPKHFFEPVFS